MLRDSWIFGAGAPEYLITDPAKPNRMLAMLCLRFVKVLELSGFRQQLKHTINWERWSVMVNGWNKFWHG